MDLQLPAYKLPGAGGGSGRFAENAQVSPPGAFSGRRGFKGGVGGALAGRRFCCGRSQGRLPDGIGKGQEVIGPGLRRCCGHRQAQHFPAPRHRQRARMLLAQIVTMRFRVRCQRAQHRSGVRVHVRQSCYR